ncbi:putative lactoylglutathione lyase [Pedobacter sp. UYEF25]
MSLQKKIADTKTTVSVINSTAVDSIDAVNDFTARALKAGAKELHEVKDNGFMQQRSMEDLDGNLWEVLFMDFSKFTQK